MSFLLDYFKCASEGPQVRLSFFSLCLQIPRIRSYSIIQKKYLIFIPKWKLFNNEVWKRGEDGSKGQGGGMGLEIVKDREMMVCVCVCIVDRWLLMFVCVWVSFANERRKNGKTGEESAKATKKAWEKWGWSGEIFTHTFLNKLHAPLILGNKMTCGVSSTGANKVLVLKLLWEWWNWMQQLNVMATRVLSCVRHWPEKKRQGLSFKKKGQIDSALPIHFCYMSAPCVWCRAALSRYIVSQLWVIFSPFFPTRLNDFISSPPPPHHLSVCRCFLRLSVSPKPSFCL